MSKLSTVLSDHNSNKYSLTLPYNPSALHV